MRPYAISYAGACERCEYCGIPQEHVALPFQIEHIIARQHCGSDDVSNLAIACERCNAFKGPNLSAIDPESGNIVPIFHPRKDRWHSHLAHARRVFWSVLQTWAGQPFAYST